MTTDRTETETEILPIVDETLSVSRRVVSTGKVSVSTVTDRVDAVVEAELATSEVEIERVPIGRDIDVMPDVRTEGDTMIVPVVEEVPVVTTKLVLREEIHIKRRHGEKVSEIPIQLLKQRAVVSREGRDTENQEEKDDG
jgi:stress response protein YsnF